MKLKKVRAWKAISGGGAIAEFTCLAAARAHAGKGGLVSETFVHQKE